MMTLYKAHYSKIVIISIFALFSSFIVNGQNHANEFLNNQNNSENKDNIYLYINPEIIYRNKSIETIENFIELEEEIQKELLNKYAPLIDSIQDSLLLSNYIQELKNTLSTMGFNVLTVSNPNLLPKTVDPTHHTLNIAQIEIEEFTEIDSLVYKRKVNEKYYKQINGFRFNSWLIYNEADTNSRLVFFLDQEIRDLFEGEINLIDGAYFASYDHIKIRPEETYLIANISGRISAQYFFNFLMNKYVWIKSLGQDNSYYGIDLRTKKIIREDYPFDNFDIVDYQ